MRRDEAYLLDILIACRKITQFTEGVSWEEFRQNELLQFALVRILEVMGEAANNISQEVQAVHPEIPWGKIIGMRNLLIRQYFRISLEIVWDTVQKDIPVLMKQVEPLIPPEEQS